MPAEVVRLPQSDAGTPTDVKVKLNYKSTAWAGLLAFLLLFGVGGFWMATAPLSGAVVAFGTVEIVGKPKMVQHPDGGVVTALEVDDGSTVHKDDIIIELDDTLLTANLNVYTNRLQQAVAKKSRLVAERDGLGAVDWDRTTLTQLGIPFSKEVEETQHKLFEARRNTKDSQLTQYREQISQYRNQLSGTNAQHASIEEQVELLKQDLESQQSLDDLRLTTKSTLRSAKRQIAELEGQAGSAVAEAARIENAISEVQIKIVQTDREFLQSVLSDLSDTESEIRDMSQQLLATQTQAARAKIRAPVSGVVHELAAHTVGGVISPGEAIMKIVPQTDNLDIQIAIDPRFIDEVALGQNAFVRFTAFDQRTTPTVLGTVTSISPSTIMEKENGASYYQAKVSLPESELSKLGLHRLIPGMPVEVHIQTGERTPLNYIMKPLMDQLSRALVER